MYWSNGELGWLIQEYNRSDCNEIGSTSEHWRELWVHLGLSVNQHKNYNQTERDAWGLMDIHSEDCCQCLRCIGLTWVIDFAQRGIWCKDYSSLLLLYHTSHQLLQDSILCLG
jgi:hypothetical protein